MGAGWGAPGTDLWPRVAAWDPFLSRRARGGSDCRRKPCSPRTSGHFCQSGGPLELGGTWGWGWGWKPSLGVIISS